MELSFSEFVFGLTRADTGPAWVLGCPFEAKGAFATEAL